MSTYNFSASASASGTKPMTTDTDAFGGGDEDFLKSLPTLDKLKSSIAQHVQEELSSLPPLPGNQVVEPLLTNILPENTNAPTDNRAKERPQTPRTRIAANVARLHNADEDLEDNIRQRMSAMNMVEYSNDAEENEEEDEEAIMNPNDARFCILEHETHY
jgi:hypothetical protein